MNDTDSRDIASGKAPGMPSFRAASRQSEADGGADFRPQRRVRGPARGLVLALGLGLILWTILAIFVVKSS